MRFLLAFIFLISNTTWGQTVGKDIEANSSTGLDYSTNYVRNPSAKKNAASTSTSSATVTQDTTNKIDNVASYSVDTSASNGYVEFTLDSVYAPATGGNCEFKGVFLGDGSLYRAQIVDGSGNLLNQTAVLSPSDATKWQPFSVTFPCAASGSRKVRITQTEAGTSPAINVGKLYYGSVTGIGSGMPVQTFTAKVSAANVVSDENVDWINGNASITDTSLFALTFTTSLFGVAPTCVVSPQTTTVGVNADIEVAATTSGISIRTSQNTTKTAYAFTISCNKAGTDYVQPTITPNQWNYPRTAYTPTFTGFGTVTNIECYHWREDEYLGIDCKFTPGTTTAVEARMTLPNNLVAQTWSQGIKVAGVYTQTIASTAHGGWALMQSATGYLTFSPNAIFGSTSQSPLSNSLGSSSFGSGDANHIVARIPIQGWTTSQNAPQLIGSVTSNASSAFRIEYATVSAAGVVSGETSDWINGNASISDTSLFALTFNTAFSSTPFCISTESGTPSSTTFSSSTDTVSTTAVSIRTMSGGAKTANGFFIMCIGPR